MSNILKYQNPSSPLLNPHKIIENIPAREWGPRKINEDGTITEGEGTNFWRAPFQYLGNKGLGIQNEKLARDLVSEFDQMRSENPDYNYILDKNYQSYDDAIGYLNHLEGLKKYLHLPYDTGLLMESKHKPTRLQGTNEKTYKFRSSTVPGYWDDVVEDMVMGEHNKNQYYDQSLNEFTAYRDRDKKGDFVSIYDEWDYNPAVRGGNKKLNKVIDSVTGGKPFVIYDRVYLDDYYDIPEEARGNPFITPAVVTAYKKGGRIHIKKKNRGKFTEYCGGKVTQECIAKGKKSKDPKIRKRATFAANARKWKHENGGVIGQFNIGGIIKAQDSAKLVSGYTTHDDDNLRNVETFNKNWLLQRDSQLAKQGLLDPEIKNNLNWWNRNMHVSNKKVADIIRNRLFSNLDETKEFSATSALKDRKGYQVLKNKLYADYPIFEWDGYDLIGPPKPLDPEILRHVFETSSAGIYSPEYRTIVYNEDFINTPTKIHERDHAMFAPINSEFSGVNAIDKETYRFKDWEVPERWGYYEDPLEVRARLMQMRFDNKLDPKHEYSDEEIESMRNDPNFKDYKIFERYNNEYIKFLLNDVAQNNMNENRFDYRSPINFAKNGGILKAQNGTGNLYVPHPLSPVGIALNQAKAMTKMKGEQQHLPPGVKEVVGPDGKKVAIRTEQPLKPLEQSIAEWLPGTGDVAEVGYIANDVKNGNYGTAALATAMIALPGNVGKLLSKHRKAVSKTADAVEDAVRKANVSEYINTVDDALPERQPLTTNKSKQFWDGTSESKLTDAEKAGVPKGERNNVYKPKVNSRRYFLRSDQLFPMDKSEVIPDDVGVSNMLKKYQLGNRTWRTRGLSFRQTASGPSLELQRAFTNDIEDFAKSLPDFDPRFAREDGIPSFYVSQFRDYLGSIGYNPSSISDETLLKIITHQYNTLVKETTGKLKGRLFFHGTDVPFESFDYHMTGKNTGNMGYNGAGNYFATYPTGYGSKYHERHFGKDWRWGLNQPYVITDIKSTPLNDGRVLPDKIGIPKYVSNSGYGTKEGYDPIIQRAISIADSGNTRNMQ